MKKFEFSLSKMLNFREQLLEKEKNALSQLFIQKNALDHHVQSVTEQLEQVRTRLEQKTREGVIISELRSLTFTLENGKKQLKQLQKDQALLNSSVELQRNAVVKASQQVSKLENLKEKQWEEYQYTLTKAEELLISEHVASTLIRQVNS
ncbi:flagellar FliJ family protein [Hydrogenoanaerobacterium sp.]|uniref:flagellar FliJ family protein n=1 Tax=Hydrogenoanaerobacterium sp. TaxID=2953763 RepID=UPI002896B773|nr:flagellar FliJ family protein [Hydrogenoanaerobacterium sp.]